MPFTRLFAHPEKAQKSHDPPVKSVSELLQLEKEKKVIVKPIELFVDSPVVGKGSTVQSPGDAATKFAYYRNEEVQYFDFGPTPNRDKTADIIHTEDSKGNILSVITTTIPGKKNFSPFWDVFNVVVPDSSLITNLKQIRKYPRVFAGVNANCPVVSVNGKPVHFDQEWEKRLSKKGYNKKY
ncbi:141_t:CDS:2 [Acaulospora colombiana]|uniref:141_t:CDS:1 n=1 Tax=Acaulospora colombiana TaxID=27376 RepID=A0ACA9JZP4_9GLOM|nr:141_t:CDS:2 [Acaulospora colombiana]